MQRAAIEPGDDERTLAAQRTVDIGRRAAFAPRTYGQSGASRVLSLNGEQPRGHLKRVASRGSGEQLRGKAFLDQ
jgi:hypothetical protein